MTGVDTNIVIRLLTRDDETQYQKSVAIFKGGEVFIPETVWLETEWVLRYAYGFGPAKIIGAFRGILGLPGVTTRDVSRLLLALDWHEAGLDFADAFHLAGSQDAADFMTFDHAFFPWRCRPGRMQGG